MRRVTIDDRTLVAQTWNHDLTELERAVVICNSSFGVYIMQGLLSAVFAAAIVLAGPAHAQPSAKELLAHSWCGWSRSQKQSYLLTFTPATPERVAFLSFAFYENGTPTSRVNHATYRLDSDQKITFVIGTFSGAMQVTAFEKEGDRIKAVFEGGGYMFQCDDPKALLFPPPH